MSRCATRTSARPTGAQWRRLSGGDGGRRGAWGATDDARVQSKLAFLERESEAATLEAAAFRALTGATDEAVRGAVLRGIKYALQVSIQAMIDIAYHVAAKDFGHAPQDAYDAFDRLDRGGVFPRGRVSVYRKMVGFRNVLVHQDQEVADEAVLELAQEAGDFGRFRQEILAYARREGRQDSSPDGGVDSGSGGGVP